jgi:hypothetical protein
VTIIDYDDIATWAPLVGAVVTAAGPPGMIDTLKASNPEYIEGAGNFIEAAMGRDRLVEALFHGLDGERVRLWHGTRVTDAEAESIRTHGLRPLTTADRSAALIAIFKAHPRWPDVSSELDAALAEFGPRQRMGRREDGCVHVCFSRAGLLRGCSHYLSHGAEVDGHVAAKVFGDQSALPLLAAARRPMLVSFDAPFAEAARAANPHGYPRQDMPSLLDLLLNSWAYREAHPGFETTSLEDCTAAKFEGIIAPERVRLLEVADADIRLR